MNYKIKKKLCFHLMNYKIIKKYLDRCLKHQLLPSLKFFCFCFCFYFNDKVYVIFETNAF